MAEKTPWRKVVCDSNFIAAWDFQDGEEKVLTIDRINQAETVETAEGKSKKAVVHWKEPGNKPMILNVERGKSIEKVAGSDKLEDWPGAAVQLYIDHNVRAFGEIVSAVRVRPFKPRVQQQAPLPPCGDCGTEIVPAMGKDARWVAAYTHKHYGIPLCVACAQKRKEAAQSEGKEAAQNEQHDEAAQSDAG